MRLTLPIVNFSARSCRLVVFAGSPGHGADAEFFSHNALDKDADDAVLVDSIAGETHVEEVGANAQEDGAVGGGGGGG